MKIAALFPGYGSQFVGMGKDLYDEYRLIQEHFEVAANCLDINFVKLCFASSDLEIAKMSNAYPALFLVSSSIFDLIRQEGIEVDLVAGYNIGQYAAMHAAGSLSLPDGLYVLAKYAESYQELLDSDEFSFYRIEGMRAKQLEQLCKKFSVGQFVVGISVYERTDHHIIAGHARAVDQVCQEVMDLEGTTEIIGPEDGLHSPLMMPIVDAFTLYRAKVDFKDGTIPLMCGTDMGIIKKGNDLLECATSWISQPVHWAQIMEKLSSYDLLIEIGPGTQLRAMIEPIYPDKKIISVNNRSDINELKTILDIKISSSEI